MTLPPISALARRCQALAALDLILSPEWEYRYYSFNAAWAPGRRMASMRNGCGDEWFCLFHPSGWAALKGLDHESRAWSKGRDELSDVLRAAIPADLTEFSAEPAFRWDATSFAYHCLGEAAPWIPAADGTKFSDLPGGEHGLLGLITGTPEDYVQYAADYFEREIDVVKVAAVFSLDPITPNVVKALNPETDWAEIEKELFSEIAYPRAG